MNGVTDWDQPNGLYPEIYLMSVEYDTLYLVDNAYDGYRTMYRPDTSGKTGNSLLIRGRFSSQKMYPIVFLNSPVEFNRYNKPIFDISGRKIHRFKNFRHQHPGAGLMVSGISSSFRLTSSAPL